MVLNPTDYPDRAAGNAAFEVWSIMRAILIEGDVTNFAFFQLGSLMMDQDESQQHAQQWSELMVNSTDCETWS